MSRVLRVTDDNYKVIVDNGSAGTITLDTTADASSLQGTVVVRVVQCTCSVLSTFESTFENTFEGTVHVHVHVYTYTYRVQIADRPCFFIQRYGSI